MGLLDILREGFNAISPIDIGGPNLPRPSPSGLDRQLPRPRSESIMATPTFEQQRVAQPGFRFGIQPLTPFPQVPGMGLGTPGTLGIQSLSIAPSPGGGGPGVNPLAPAGIGGAAMPGAMPGGGGTSTLERLALLSAILGGASNVI